MIGFSTEDGRIFFNNGSVKALMAKRTDQALERFGAFVRTRARSSLKSRKKVAKAGSPPSVHEGGIKRLTVFALDKRANSVVIGPLAYRANKARQIEEGGTIATMKRGGKVQMMRYRPHPWLQPAFEKELATAAKNWSEKS